MRIGFITKFYFTSITYSKLITKCHGVYFVSGSVEYLSMLQENKQMARGVISALFWSCK